MFIESVFNDVQENYQEYLDWMTDILKEAAKTTAITYACLGVFIVVLRLIFG